MKVLTAANVQNTLAANLKWGFPASRYADSLQREVRGERLQDLVLRLLSLRTLEGGGIVDLPEGVKGEAVAYCERQIFQIFNLKTRPDKIVVARLGEASVLLDLGARELSIGGSADV